MLKKGEIYYSDNSSDTNQKQGFIKIGGGSHICIATRYFYKGNYSDVVDKSNFRLATGFEKRWILECEKQNRFVPREEIKTDEIINNYQII